MATVHETLQQLRTEYLVEAVENVGRIDRMIGRLEAEGPDPGVLESLHRRFLGLAGSGFTYGFPLVSRLGREGERTCAAFLRNDQPLPPREIHDLRRLLGELRDEFERLHAAYSVGPWLRRTAPSDRTRTTAWALWPA